MKSNASTADPSRPAKSEVLPELCPMRSHVPAGLVLLGTVHSDPNGFSRTRAFLELYGPDLILVEISPFALQFRKEHSSELRKTLFCNIRTVSKKLGIGQGAIQKHAQIASVLRQFAIPFEYRASAAYSKRAGARLVAVDYSDFSRQWIGTWPEMISSENIEQLLQLKGSSPSVSSLYAGATRRLGGCDFYPDTLPGGDAHCWREREEHMAAEITSAVRVFDPKRPVFIGGWWHLSSGRSVRTLREILGVGPSSCLLLDRGPLDMRGDCAAG
jgi:hypothetical protein